jgi:transcriptional regulator with GAF, ATPase, and Fis domain
LAAHDSRPRRSCLATARAFEQIEQLRAKLELENEYLREEVTRAGAFGELIGQGPALEAVARQIDLVAPTDAAVLILGESGTGKELVAREVHRRSKRATRPLVKVNCAAVPRELYESEFFGHAKGSFTGALRDRAGRFCDRSGFFIAPAPGLGWLGGGEGGPLVARRASVHFMAATRRLRPLSR